MLNLRCIFPSVCAFSLLLFICEIENTTVKIYYRWAGGQESKILLKNNKRWKNMSVNYKTRHVRTVQSSNQASALKNRGDRKLLCKWNWHIWIRLHAWVCYTLCLSAFVVRKPVLKFIPGVCHVWKWQVAP